MADADGASAGGPRPEEGFKCLDPATLIPLLRARRPDKDLGAFLRLSRDALRRSSLHHDGQFDSFVRFALRTAERGPLATIDVEVHLVAALHPWSAGDLKALHVRLAEAWPDARGGRHRILQRVAALARVATLLEGPQPRLPRSMQYVVHFALDVSRPPIWTTRVRERLPLTRPRPGRDEMRSALAILEAEAPLVWRLAGPDLVQIAALLPEQGDDTEPEEAHP